MSEILKIDQWSLIFLVFFLIPGLMLVQGFELGRHTKTSTIGKDDLVVYPVFGLLYNLTLLSLGYSLPTGITITTIPTQYIVITYGILPIFSGILLGIFVRFGLFYKIAKTLRIRLDEPAPPMRTP